MAPSPDDLAPLLARFGLSAFRPGQEDVIRAVLAGHDCLCIMPTGGGKSLCYQLPAVARPGVTLVVSPLIALMKDQVDALVRRQIRATFINSSLGLDEQQQRLAEMATGAYDLVYIAPERFRSSRFTEALRATRVQLLAVDEAHCISEWGHDFRHDYTRLGRFREQIGNPQTIALTATATAEVRRDVAEQLRLRDPKTFLAGFARPNLHYEVERLSRDREKDDALVAFLAATPGCGIIYCSTRRRCEDVADVVRSGGRRKTTIYHGGMLPDDRRKAQEDFMQGRTEVVVATNAFGMGIDKADVRFVVHYNLPGSLEAYYQEAGRAGRDGLPSRCLFLFSPADRFVQEFFIESNNPSREVIAEVYEFLRSCETNPIEMTQQEIKEELGLSIAAEGVGTCEQILERCGVLERIEARKNLALVRLSSELPTLVDLVPAAATAQRRVLRALERMVGDRRGEHVYFHPSILTEQTGMDAAAVSRALRELNRLECFEFVPPFRGKAVHMRRRDLDFDKLDIDFEKLERRRQAEYEKLDRVLAFARSTRCRQQEILRYFGAPLDAPCGHCDNCLARGRRPAAREAAVARIDARHEAAAGAAAPAGVAKEPLAVAAVTPFAAEVVEAVRMALSGVARTKGRFGKNIVAQMLWGSKSAKLARWKIDQLSTFGLLAHLRLSDVLTLLDALIEAGLVDQQEVDRFKPVVVLTPRGEEVMRSQAPLGEEFRLPAPLLRLLAGRGSRTTAAPRAEAASAPVAAAPRRVEGKRAAPAPERPVAALDPDDSSAAVPDNGARRPDWHWTWLLFVRGFDAESCAAIRRLSRLALVEHLQQAVESGLTVEPSWVLTPKEMVRFEAAAAQTNAPEESVSGDPLEAATLHLYRTCRQDARSRA